MQKSFRKIQQEGFKGISVGNVSEAFGNLWIPVYRYCDFYEEGGEEALKEISSIEIAIEFLAYEFFWSLKKYRSL
jgi:hypothetical protein